ncbi:MAG TPA: sigma-54-dependent Fis family transcriptional regulator [Proteobacteria bacterium]|nr:sigma-54-dependent Fis family transcriptional regulator [Pseudomonadota bacterium]
MSKRILLVDDEPDILLSLKTILSRAGYRVGTAASVQEAMDAVHRDLPDVVVLDIVMQGPKDGVELLKRIKRDYPHMQVIMLSGKGNIQVAVETMKLGAFDYLEKPVTADNLLVKIKNAIELVQTKQELTLLRQRAEEHRLIGSSEAVRRLRELIERAAPTDSCVLITGEHGTGKEVVAWEIHRLSRRSSKAFIEVNCAAIPKDLIESELFGHEKGAFTGATSSKPGKFELAHNGTIFLDEVADMSAEAQAKILRILQEKRFTRVGGTRMVEVDVRIIAATNRDLKKEIAEGRFREDLYYRLNVVPIHVPPLRDRTEDIPDLAKHFAEQLIHHGWPKKSFSQKALEAMCEYRWPGNVRELKNLVERLMILVPSDVIDEGDVREALGAEAVRLSELDERLNELPLREARKRFERAFIANRLAEFNWNISRTAEALGIERSHLHRKIKELGIQTARSADDAQAEED